jgi:hypothetical protein
MPPMGPVPDVGLAGPCGVRPSSGVGGSPLAGAAPLRACAASASGLALGPLALVPASLVSGLKERLRELAAAMDAARSEVEYQVPGEGGGHTEP